MQTLTLDVKRVGKIAVAMVLGTSLAACSNIPDITSRNAPFEPVSGAATPVAASVSQARQMPPSTKQLPVSITAINVNVPRTLTASEANRYYPKADIVWRGDPIGDRHVQIAQIIDTAFHTGTADMSGPTGVVLDVEVVRFHSVTEKARYSVGGVHNIVFKLTVRRATTGEALGQTRLIKADLPALGGSAAIEADRNGQTQKVRVSDFLAQTIRQELARFVSA
ncbi:MAG: DUF6778 family protein [Sulfitobacter sp.]